MNGHYYLAMNPPHPSISHLTQIPSPFPNFYAAAWRDETIPPPSPGVIMIVEWDCEPILFTTMSKEGELHLVVAVDERTDERGRVYTYLVARVPPEWAKECVFTRPIFEMAERVFVVCYEPLQPRQVAAETPLRYWEVRGEEVPKEWLPDDDTFITEQLQIGALRTTSDTTCSSREGSHG